MKTMEDFTPMYKVAVQNLITAIVNTYVDDPRKPLNWSGNNGVAEWTMNREILNIMSSLIGIASTLDGKEPSYDSSIQYIERCFAEIFTSLSKMLEICGQLGTTATYIAQNMESIRIDAVRDIEDFKSKEY